MQLLRSTLLILIATFGICVLAQQFNAATDQQALVAVMLQSDVKKMLGFMSAMVEVELPTQRGVFNHNQLQPALSNFFKLYPPKSITIHQRGALNTVNDYFIGTYQSGETAYRLYMQAENHRDGLKIFSLSIKLQ